MTYAQTSRPRALARLSDFDQLPDAALVAAPDFAVLLGGLSRPAFDAFAAKRLGPAVRLSAGGMRYWQALEVRVALAALAANRGTA
jgi:hypothetical protein